MKQKLNYFIMGTFLFSILALMLLMKSNTCFAAQSESKLSGVTTLEKDTAYEYDLNGDGKAEKILYNLTVNDEKFTVALNLYINDKLCFTKTSHGFLYTLLICDLDKNDNYLDLYAASKAESDCTMDSFFARYNGEKLFNVVQFKPDKIIKNFTSIRYSLESVNGDGTFTTVIDTPIYSNAIGCYNCYVPYQLKGKTISKVSGNAYTLTKYSKDYQYKAAKSFSVYRTAGSKKAVYTVKKGDAVTFDKLYIAKSGKVYFRISNSKGMKGWIRSYQEGLFSNIPQWG